VFSKIDKSNTCTVEHLKQYVDTDFTLGARSVVASSNASIMQSKTVNTKSEQSVDDKRSTAEEPASAVGENQTFDGNSKWNARGITAAF